MSDPFPALQHSLSTGARSVRPPAWRRSRWSVFVPLALAALAMGWAFPDTVTAAPDGAPEERTSVTLVLQWNHQSQFAGYYMAEAQGFYQRRGLDARILRGGADVRPSQMLRDGQADFVSTMLSTALERRDEGLSMTLLAQVVNRSNFTLVTRKFPHGPDGPAIRNPGDLAGRAVTVWEQDFRAPYLAFFNAYNVRPHILPQYYTLSLFLHGGADGCSAMWYNEYHTLLLSGMVPEDLTVFKLWEHGVQLPEDGLYGLEATWRERPEMCRAFVAASLEGWQYARDHRDETLDVVMDHVRRDHLPTNRAHMAWMLDQILASIFPGPDDAWTFGRLSQEAYEEATQLLLRSGSVEAVPPFDAFFQKEALNEAF